MNQQSGTTSEEIKILLERVEALPQSCEARIAFDAWANRFITTTSGRELLEEADDSATKVVFFDRDSGEIVDSVDFDSFLALPAQSTSLPEGALEDRLASKEDTASADLKRAKLYDLEAGDSLSILRFVRGNKSKRLEISPSGKV